MCCDQLSQWRHTLYTSSKFFGDGYLIPGISNSHREFWHFKNKNWLLIASSELRRGLTHMVHSTDLDSHSTRTVMSQWTHQWLPSFFFIAWHLKNVSNQRWPTSQFKNKRIFKNTLYSQSSKKLIRIAIYPSPRAIIYTFPFCTSALCF